MSDFKDKSGDEYESLSSDDDENESQKQVLNNSDESIDYEVSENSQSEEVITVNSLGPDNSEETADSQCEGETPIKRLRRSKIWDFFNTTEDGYAKCKFCEVPINKAMGNTTSMRRHLRHKHAAENIQLEACEKSENSEKPKKQLSIAESYAQVTLFSPKHPRAIKITNSIACMIALDFQPYRIVENRGFKKVLNECEPRYQMPSRTTFSRSVVPKLYKTVKKEMEEDIAKALKEGVESVSFTTDFWKSKSNNCFLGITCHFLTKKFEQKIYTLACLPFVERHTADNILTVLAELVSNIVPVECRGSFPIYVVTDNAPNITKAINISEWTHLPCFCHTLQLVINDSFKQLKLGDTSVKEILAKVRAIVGHFKMSPQADKLLRNMQVSLFGVPENQTKQLYQDVVTRWNSEYYMLKRIYELRQPVSNVLLEVRSIDNLMNMEWDIVRTLIDILEPFEISSKDLEGDTYPTLNLIFPALHYIDKQLKKSKSAPCHLEANVAGVFFNNLQSRFPNYRMESLYLFGMLLDPRIKTVLLDKSEKSYAKQLLKTELDQMYAGGHLVEVENEILIEKEETHKRKGLWKQVVKESKENIMTRKNWSLSEEVNVYIKEPIEDPESNIYDYWKLRVPKFPHLARLTRRYLMIPASSASSERLFSSAGNIETEKRSTLLPEHVEQLTILNASLKNWKF